MKTGKIIAFIIYLAINGLFILKYAERTPFNPLLCLFAYIVIVTALFRFPTLWKKAKVGLSFIPHPSSLLIIITTLAIAALLITIDPMSVRVDRWSATTYFLDALFSGQYPYGVHTHVSTTNFPSPFPLWHYLNIPFWLIGDVGIGLIAVLWLTLFSIKSFSPLSSGEGQGMRTFLLLLALSPAYWWEVAVRSDGLSNALLVFCVILWLEHKHYSFTNRWILTAILCGLIASTRLSAVIPIGLYLMASYFKSDLRTKILTPLIVFGIVFLMFLPYIFWDTDTWVFFSRNPFMSQTSTGNIYTLLLMAVIAIVGVFYVVERKKERENRFWLFNIFTAVYLFVFFLLALCYNHFTFNVSTPIWSDADFDISYLTLALPYCIYSMCRFGVKNEEN